MPRATLLLALALASCGNRDRPDLDAYSFAGGCYTVSTGKSWLQSRGSKAGFTADEAGQATPFTLRASDLGTYLLYDPDGGYVVAEARRLSRATVIESDVTLNDDSYISGAEWILETHERARDAYQLRSRRHDRLLAEDGLTDESKHALALSFEPAKGCRAFPELSVDATGTVQKTTFDDGDLYGIVDTHSHILSNFGFGGGGIYHGGAFHRLGVEHALGSCEYAHGIDGKQDFFGYAYGAESEDFSSFIPDLLRGELSEPVHSTDGYPEFTDWPDTRKHRTHQTQYYRWLERAYLAGLRLVVQHATSNSVICNLTAGQGFQPKRYDCEDMTAVDRIIDETYAMERYIDAQAGGPGQGWFRIVETPAEARQVIRDGDLAVILGIETSDLFRCNLTPRPDGPVCDEAYVDAQLDEYYGRGVRALFPVHKFSNRFTPGDGQSDFIEAGDFLNSGHWTNKTEDCPPDDTMPHGYDDGGVAFGGLLEPRDVYLSEPPNDFSDFPNEPLLTVGPHVIDLTEPPVEGDFCMNASFTPIGEHLIEGMMQRGMILELDHLPQWSYHRAFEILEANDYPGAGTHGRHWDGRIYETGGISVSTLGRCQDPDDPGASLRSYQAKIDLIRSKGGYPAEGFSFDYNGFAGGPEPRFGDEGCALQPQPNPISYPFGSYAGDVEFTAPYAGNRAFDFDTEGMAHIGLLPELLQDARADALSDADLEPLFRSAEGYIRMWEKAEARSRELRRR